MPLYLLYTMVQKSQKRPKTQIKGGPALLIFTSHTHSVYKPGALPSATWKKQKKPPGTNFACVVTSSPRFLPASDSEWPHHCICHKDDGGGKHRAFSQCVTTCFVLSLGRHRRAEVSSLPRLQTTGSGSRKSRHKLLGTSMKAKFFLGRKCLMHQTVGCWGRGKSISQPDEWQITSASWAHLTTEN